MREGLKRRIQGPATFNTMTIINKTHIAKNKENKRIGNSNCSHKPVCGESGVSCTSTCTSSLSNKSMFYSAPFRQPVKGWRKSLPCSEDKSKNQCWEHTEVYKDPYAYDKQSSATDTGKKCVQGNFGSLSNTNIPTGEEKRAVSGINSRTTKPLIRSGMQPNTAGQQNSGKDFVDPKNPKRYSY